jgi:hypothetical protein
MTETAKLISAFIVSNQMVTPLGISLKAATTDRNIIISACQAISRRRRILMATVERTRRFFVLLPECGISGKVQTAQSFNINSD